MNHMVMNNVKMNMLLHLTDIVSVMNAYRIKVTLFIHYYA